MKEDATVTLPRPNPSVWEQMISFIAMVASKIFSSIEERCFSRRRQEELEKAHKTVRMAENYGDTFEDTAQRIIEESARYKAFKENPQPIGKISLTVKQLDSALKQYEVIDPYDGEMTVVYSHRRSAETVLEFVVHDKDGVPLFPIARSYANYFGCKEFDLGLDQVFYLKMVKDKRPDYVAVQAGFKDKDAPIPVLTRSDVSEREDIAKPTDPWRVKRTMLLASAQALLIVLYVAAVKVTANSSPEPQVNLAAYRSEGAVQTIAVPQITKIVFKQVSPLSTYLTDNWLALGGEINGPRKDHAKSTAKHPMHIGTFVVNVNGNDVQFLIAYEQLQTSNDTFLPAITDDTKSLLDLEYGFARQQLVGNTDELAKILIQIIADRSNPESGSDEKRSEVAMTE